MKRSPLRARTSPIARGTGLARTGRLAQHQSRVIGNRSWQLARRVVYIRSGGACDMCGYTLDAEVWQCHHRRLRSQGGTDDPVNLLALHRGCHDFAHGNPELAVARGWIVPSWADPATVPWVRFRGPH